MATVAEIYEFLNNKAPFESQLSYDNSGFLVGRGEAVVTCVLVSLDITEAVVREAAACGAQLIVSHHPVIFSAVKTVTDRDTTGRLVLLLAEHGIAAICAHTNLDIAAGGVNDALADRLGLELATPLGADGVGRVGWLTGGPIPLATFTARAKAALETGALRAVDSGRPVRYVAVGGGACGDYLADAAALGCDTLVTADVKYHTFLEAQTLGINLLDAGHFATEQVVCPVLEVWLREGFPSMEILQTAVHREPVNWF